LKIEMMDDPMPFAFFTVPVRDSNAAVEDLNRLMASRRILSVDRRWVDVGPDSFWSICVDYLDGSQPKSSTAQLRGKVDYKEILKPEEFALFAKLRDWRTGVSQKEAVPVYTIFTNEQIAEIVRTRATTKAAIGLIEGIGEGRIEKYGAAVLSVIQDRIAATPPTAS